MTGTTKYRWFTGTPYLEGATWKDAHQALARVGANYFRSQDFTQCRYIGYKGPLKGEYDIDDDVILTEDSPEHRYCSVVTFDYTGAARFSFADKSRRASRAQQVF
jgi:hypothetical protein